MSRKKKPKNFKDPCASPSDIYWQSAYYNTQIYYTWRDVLLNLAIARFKWINLPPTCDARYLEYTLLTQGCATIAFPRSQRGVFYSTMMTTQGKPNVYDNPSRWRSIGNNGWNFNVSARNGVVIYDNMSRFPKMQAIDIYARELADIMRTKQINRMHQKKPFALKGAQTQQNDMLNLYKQVVGNEPAVFLYDDMQGIEVDKIDLTVPFLGKELQADFTNTLNSIYFILGIPNLPFKTERQIEDEVTSLGAATEISLMSPLSERRRACDKLNNRFSMYLDKPIEVIWNEDTISDNMNFINNFVQQAKYGTELGHLIDAKTYQTKINEVSGEVDDVPLS